MPELVPHEKYWVQAHPFGQSGRPPKLSFTCLGFFYHFFWQISGYQTICISFLSLNPNLAQMLNGLNFSIQARPKCWNLRSKPGITHAPSHEFAFIPIWQHSSNHCPWTEYPKELTAIKLWITPPPSHTHTQQTKKKNWTPWTPWLSCILVGPTALFTPKLGAQLVVSLCFYIVDHFLDHWILKLSAFRNCQLKIMVRLHLKAKGKNKNK